MKDWCEYCGGDHLFDDCAEYQQGPEPEGGREGWCTVCGNPIEIMINRGSGFCSENCRKDRAHRELIVDVMSPSGDTSGAVHNRGGWVPPPRWMYEMFGRQP